MAVSKLGQGPERISGRLCQYVSCIELLRFFPLYKAEDKSYDLPNNKRSDRESLRNQSMHI